MDLTGFKQFLAEEEDKNISGIPNMVRQMLGVPTNLVNKAMDGMFPTVNSQLILPVGKSKLQMSVLPTMYKVSPDGKHGKVELMTQESPYIYANDADIAKVLNKRNIKLDLRGKDIDKLVFQGMPIAPPAAAAGAPPM